MSIISGGLGWQLLAASAAQVTHTGDTNEFALATVTIPANALGPNGLLRVYTMFSYPNSGNTKTFRLRYSGIGGTNMGGGGAQTTSTLYTDMRYIMNVNATNVQKAWNAASANGGWATSAGALAAAAVDTTAATTLVITGQLGSGAETLALEMYVVELMRQ